MDIYSNSDQITAEKSKTLSYSMFAMILKIPKCLIYWYIFLLKLQIMEMNTNWEIQLSNDP